MKLMDRKRKEFLMFCLLVLLTGLIILHLAVFRELDRAREVIDARDKELVLCWELNQYRDPTNFREEKFIYIENRIQDLQPRLDPILRQKIAIAILKNSTRYKLSPSLIIHLICRETQPKFNPLSKSKKGAIGLMQVMYKVHIKHNPELAKLKPEELYHVGSNIKFGCQILRGYINSTESLDKALKKYVGGNVDGYAADIYRMMADWEQGKYSSIKRSQWTKKN